MATIPSTDNYTVPGGIKVFFNDGTGERDLGNIVGDSLTVSRDTEELEHFSNRSGTRLKDKVITIEEAVQFDFNLDEIVIENLRFFFKGGSLTSVGAGTNTVTDQIETLTGEIFSSVEKAGITAVSVRQFLNYMRLDTTGAGSTFTNNDTEMDTAAGTPFTILGDINDIAYLGKDTQYKEVYFDLGTLGDYTNSVTWEYWAGASWTVLVTAGSDNLEASGVMTFTPPSDWAATTVNSQSAFWIRAQASSFTIAATANSIGRQALVDLTDYKVDPGFATGINARQDGRIARIDSGGSLVSGEQVKTSFTYVTFTSQTFGIAGVATIEGSARVEVHPSSGRGSTYDIIIPKAQLISNGNMDLNDSEFQEIPMSLVVLDNSSVSATDPFGTVQVFDAVS